MTATIAPLWPPLHRQAVPAVTPTALARQMAAQLTHEPYRDADTGAWCQPEPPHVDGCTCTGGPRCDTCWRAWQHHVATTGSQP